MSVNIPKIVYSDIRKKADDVKKEYSITGPNFDIYEFLEFDLKMSSAAKI